MQAVDTAQDHSYLFAQHRTATALTMQVRGIVYNVLRDIYIYASIWPGPDWGMEYRGDSEKLKNTNFQHFVESPEISFLFMRSRARPICCGACSSAPPQSARWQLHCRSPRGRSGGKVGCAMNGGGNCVDMSLFSCSIRFFFFNSSLWSSLLTHCNLYLPCTYILLLRCKAEIIWFNFFLPKNALFEKCSSPSPVVASARHFMPTLDPEKQKELELKQAMDDIKAEERVAKRKERKLQGGGARCGWGWGGENFHALVFFMRVECGAEMMCSRALFCCRATSIKTMGKNDQFEFEFTLPFPFRGGGGGGGYRRGGGLKDFLEANDNLNYMGGGSEDKYEDDEEDEDLDERGRKKKALDRIRRNVDDAGEERIMEAKRAATKRARPEREESHSEEEGGAAEISDVSEGEEEEDEEDENLAKRRKGVLAFSDDDE